MGIDYPIGFIAAEVEEVLAIQTAESEENVGGSGRQRVEPVQAPDRRIEHRASADGGWPEVLPVRSGQGICAYGETEFQSRSKMGIASITLKQAVEKEIPRKCRWLMSSNTYFRYRWVPCSRLSPSG